MPEKDLLERFDAAMPPLELFPLRSVPKSGHAELHEHVERVKDRRVDLGLYTTIAAALGGLAWLLWSPWMPLWILSIIVTSSGVSGMAAARRFMQLAFGKRLEHALPPGTSERTALLEDGIQSLVRAWNADAYMWNGHVARLRLELSGWQLLETVPEARDIEWSEAGSRAQAEALLAEMRGFLAEREALVVRKKAIERKLAELYGLLRRLAASEELPRAALPPHEPEPEDDG